jgi:hypothetical protein
MNQSIENMTNLSGSGESIESLPTITTLMIALLPIKIALMVTTVCANMLLIVTIGFLVKEKTYSYCLFWSTSFSDFFIGLFSWPSMIVFTTYARWPIGIQLCKFWIINDFSCGCVTIMNLLLITIHRYRQLTSPTKTTETMSKLKVARIFLVWTLFYTYWTGSAVPIVSKNYIDQSCYFMYTFAYALTSTMLAGGIPIPTVILINILTLIALRKQMKKLFQNRSNALRMQIKQRTGAGISNQKPFSAAAKSLTVSNNNIKKDTNDNSQQSASVGISNRPLPTVASVTSTKQKAKSLNKETRATLCILTISTVLLLCWSTVFIAWPLTAYCVDCVHPVVYEMGYWTAYFFSTLNPFILLTFHSDLRLKALGLLKKIALKLK